MLWKSSKRGLRNPVKRAEYDQRLHSTRSRYQQEYRQQTTYRQSEEVRWTRDQTLRRTQEREDPWRNERANREPAETEKPRLEDIRRQKINQLDHEISLLHGEINRLTKELPTMPNPTLGFGFMIAGVYALAFGMLDSKADLLALGGLVSILFGIQLLVSRNRFYRENYKPAYNNIEKHKQHLRQLVRENQYLRKA